MKCLKGSKGFSLTSMMIATALLGFIAFVAAQLTKSIFSQGDVAQAKGILTSESQLARSMTTSSQMIEAVRANDLLLSNATQKPALEACLRGQGSACNAATWTNENPLVLLTRPTVAALLNKQGSFSRGNNCSGTSCDYSVESSYRYVCPDGSSCVALEIKSVTRVIGNKYTASLKPFYTASSIRAAQLLQSENLNLSCPAGKAPQGFDTVSKTPICVELTNPCKGSGAICMPLRDANIVNKDFNGNGEPDPTAPRTAFALESVSFNQFTASAAPRDLSLGFTRINLVESLEGCSRQCSEGRNIYKINKKCEKFSRTPKGNDTKGIVADSFCPSIAPNPEFRIAQAESCSSGACYAWVASAWSACSKTCGTGDQSRSYVCTNRVTSAITLNANRSAQVQGSAQGTVVADSFCTNMGLTKPSAESQSCWAGPCCYPYHVNTGDYSSVDEARAAATCVSGYTFKETSCFWNPGAGYNTDGTGKKYKCDGNCVCN